MSETSQVDQAIQDVVRGRTFIDIGGLWGEKNEKATVAALAGASAVTMMDILPQSHDLWGTFDQRRQSLGVGPVDCVTGNIEDAEFMAGLGQFDVVHTNGVIYHLPNPLLALLNLRKMTRKTLFLGSMTMPEVISNRHGTLTLKGGATIFIPALSDSDRLIVKAHLDEKHLTIHNINSEAHYPWVSDSLEFNCEPWWWLWSADTLARLAAAAGFRVRRVIDAWAGYSHVVECEAV